MKHLSATGNSPGDSDYGEQLKAVAASAIFPLVSSGFQVLRVKGAAKVRCDIAQIQQKSL